MPAMSPDFLCIGTQRCGTTWLHRALSAHPAYWMPPFKELDFFSPEGPEGNRRDKMIWMHHALGRQLRDGVEDRAELAWLAALVTAETKDLGWYQGLFSPARGRISGDISPAYFRLDDAGVARVRDALPDAHIVMMLRHPVERADSQVGLMQQWKRWPADLPEAELVRRVTAAPFGAFGDYAAVVARWEAAFGEDQVSVVFHDEIKARPAETLLRITTALGAPVDAASVGIDPAKRVNGAKRGARSPGFYGALARHFLPRVAPLRARWPDPVGRWCDEMRALSTLPPLG
jgi:hypothetical protein